MDIDILFRWEITSSSPSLKYHSINPPELTLPLLQWKPQPASAFTPLFFTDSRTCYYHPWEKLLASNSICTMSYNLQIKKLCNISNLNCHPWFLYWTFILSGLKFMEFCFIVLFFISVFFFLWHFVIIYLQMCRNSLAYKVQIQEALLSYFKLFQHFHFLSWL